MSNFYICDGKCDCNLDKNGKKNKYCYANGGEDAWCKHTTDINHARYKTHDFEGGFEETSENHFFEKEK